MPIFKTQEHLVSSFSNLILLGAELRRQKDLGAYTTLRTRIEKLINEADGMALENFSRENVNEAKFAVVAFLDEMILNSGWEQKLEWAKTPLQFIFFKERNAGAKFFDNLTRIRKALPSNVQVLEVFFHCLALGFEGRYKLNERERLRELLNDLSQEITYSLDGAHKLSPADGKPSKELIEEVKQGLPIWVMGVCSVSIVLVSYLFFSAVINYEGAALIQELKRVVASQLQ